MVEVVCTEELVEVADSVCVELKRDGEADACEFEAEETLREEVMSLTEEVGETVPDFVVLELSDLVRDVVVGRDTEELGLLELAILLAK